MMGIEKPAENASGGTAAIKVTVTLNGPYIVEGAIPLANQTIQSDSEGGSREWLEGPPFEVAEEYHLCRCRQSANKPFCDKTPLKVGFDGNGKASRAPYLAQAAGCGGPTTELAHAQPLRATG